MISRLCIVLIKVTKGKRVHNAESQLKKMKRKNNNRYNLGNNCIWKHKNFPDYNSEIHAIG